MTGPFPFSRQTMPLDRMIEQAGAPGWKFFEDMFKPAGVSDRFDPGADMKKFLAAFEQTAQGRQFLEWIADLTVRAPFPHVGSSRDAAWIAGAKHEARFGVGSVIFKAVADGRELLSKPKEPTT